MFRIKIHIVTYAYTVFLLNIYVYTYAIKNID